ncbi:hypothetical protein Tco_1043329 [Tanacetum coccineum]|uniref:Uncharacterized protein n=1 Tax=Tanacetum coccineum TaxID=301880 RepID=A0ABQ5GMN2_9ASTR
MAKILIGNLWGVTFFPRELGTPSRVLTNLEDRNTTLLQTLDLTVHDLDRCEKYCELGSVDLEFKSIGDDSKFDENLKKLLLVSYESVEVGFELIVITKALTLRGFARSVLLLRLLFQGGWVLGSSSQELPVVEGCKLLPSPSASL